MHDASRNGKLNGVEFKLLPGHDVDQLEVENDGTESRRRSASIAPPVGAKRSYMHSLIVSTYVYQGNIAINIRSVLQGKKFALFMILALLLTLYLPDLWIICSVNSNLELDVILCMVLVLFVAESTVLCCIDANYFLSFFHFMDAIGTLSMVFDISFLLGVDVTNKTISHTSNHSHKMHHSKQLMFLRAARAARVGSRAGRLSRVLRMFRFLSFLSSADSASDDAPASAGIAKVISEQLANLLATRVASLTIILVMVIPMFDMLSFPQSDNALEAWVERISASLQAGSTSQLQAELSRMVDFFSKHNYGPYSACSGHVTTHGSFVCEQYFSDWHPVISEPPREASAMVLHTETCMVIFNMHWPITLGAALAMANMTFVITIMMFSGLALSSVVTELTVRPLERMLLTVRQIASTVFKFSEDVAGEEMDLQEDVNDIDSTSEMILLEKVVVKLAKIAALQTVQEHMQTTDDMQDEDIAILHMMQGKTIQSSGGQATKTRASTRRHSVTPNMTLEHFSVSPSFIIHGPSTLLLWNQNNVAQSQCLQLRAFMDLVKDL